MCCQIRVYEIVVGKQARKGIDLESALHGVTQMLL